MKLQPLLQDLSENNENQEIQATGLSLDSQHLMPGELFIAVKGQQSDGRAYFAQAAASRRPCSGRQDGHATEMIDPIARPVFMTWGTIAQAGLPMAGAFWFSTCWVASVRMRVWLAFTNRRTTSGGIGDEANGAYTTYSG